MPAAANRPADNADGLVIEGGVLGPPGRGGRLLEQHAGATRKACRSQLRGDAAFQRRQKPGDLASHITGHLTFCRGDGLGLIRLHGQQPGT